MNGLDAGDFAAFGVLAPCGFDVDLALPFEAFSVVEEAEAAEGAGDAGFAVGGEGHRGDHVGDGDGVCDGFVGDAPEAELGV